MHGMTSVLDGIITVNHFGVVYVLRQMGTSKYWEFDATKLLGGDLIHSSCLEDTGDQFISIEGDHEFYANTLNKYYSIAVLAMASMEAKAS
jgi:hypothetical protein